MLCCMEDTAHDKEHIYRVLYNALEIAKTENNVNYDVLIAACLLHDIGRKEQFENTALCHAIVGSEKATIIAKERQHIAIEFYNSLYQEVNSSYKNGINELNKLVQ